MNQVQQQQTQQPVAQGGGTSAASGSTQSTIAYPHSTYRSTQSQSTVRRVYDIGNSEFEGEVNMLQITDHETEYYIIDDDLLTISTRTSTTWDDDFHQWVGQWFRCELTSQEVLQGGQRSWQPTSTTRLPRTKVECGRYSRNRD